MRVAVNVANAKRGPFGLRFPPMTHLSSAKNENRIVIFCKLFIVSILSYARLSLFPLFPLLFSKKKEKGPRKGEGDRRLGVRAACSSNIRLHPVASGSVPLSVPPGSRPTIQNPPRCHLGLLRQTLRPSKGSIWLSSTLTRTCSDGLPPKLTCSGTSASARLRFTKWCSLSNERD